MVKIGDKQLGPDRSFVGYIGVGIEVTDRKLACFCREFSKQHNVEIDFSHKDVPNELAKGISLCLFRVLQEALQNALKHSGMRHFTVELHGTSAEIHMAVSDLGVGFDQQDAANQGLGLIRMREGMRMVKGELVIKSEPGRGTTVQGLVPFSSSPPARRVV